MVQLKGRGETGVNMGHAQEHVIVLQLITGLEITVVVQNHAQEMIQNLLLDAKVRTHIQ